MPQYRTLNKDFFKTWSPEMAYVLGYIAADGAITVGKRGNHYLEVQSTDHELPQMVRQVLGSNHKISAAKLNPKWQVRYRLQVGSKEMVDDLGKLGIVPRKTKRLMLPQMPREYFRDFVRGYFDGDGNVSYARFLRKNRNNRVGHYIRVLFTSSSEAMLKSLQEQVEEGLGVSGSLRKDKNWYRLYYHRKEDVAKFFQFMYGHKPGLYLQRKFVYFEDALGKMNDVGR